EEGTFVTLGFMLTQPIKEEPTKLLAIVSPNWDGSTLRIDIKLGNAKGEIISTCASYVGWGANIFEDLPQTVSQDEPAQESGAKFKLSPLAEELRVLVSSAGDGEEKQQESAPPSEELKRLVMNPEQNEP